MNNFNYKTKILDEKFYFPPAISKKLNDEDSIFYKSFRVQSTSHNNNNQTEIPKLSYLTQSPKYFNYASYIIKSNNSKS